MNNLIFRLNSRITHPLYTNDLKINFGKENNQMFFRKKLSGSLKFIAGDYQFIHDADLETEFVLEIINRNNTDTLLYKGAFWKTDCEFDDDNKTVKVSPNTKDRYTKLLEDYETEFDLIKLRPILSDVQVFKRPILQVYYKNDTVLTNLVGGISWETECEQVNDDNKLTSDYKFAKASETYYVDIVDDDGEPTVSFSGARKEMYATNPDSTVFNKLVFGMTNEPDPTDPLEDIYYWALFTDDGTEAYRTRLLNITEVDDQFRPGHSTVLIKRTGYTGPGAHFKVCSTEVRAVYSRWMLNVAEIQTTPIFSIPDPDIVDNNLNYRYVMPYPCKVYVYGGTSTEPTKWGKVAGEPRYYDYPKEITGQPYPVGKSRWGEVSLWTEYRAIDDTYEAAGTYKININNCINIAHAIEVLLENIDRNITHKPTEAYSNIMYGNNLVANEQFYLYLTPKSNLLHGEKAQPAQKAPITFQDIANMLKQAFDCYFYIDDTNRLRIEHISFFKNSYAYDSDEWKPWAQADITTGLPGDDYQSPSDSIDIDELNAGYTSIDLTSLIAPNGKTLEFGQSKRKYEKENMPSQITRSWADEVTPVAEGFPIVMRSAFVQKGNIDDRSISNFTADVDYMLANPSAIQEDGFALLATYARKYTLGTLSAVHNYDIVLMPGFINDKGYLYYQPGSLGTGWLHGYLDVEPNSTYSLLGRDGEVLSGVWWVQFKADGTCLGKASTEGGIISTGPTTKRLALSFQNETYAIPTELPKLDYIGSHIENTSPEVPFETLDFDLGRVKVQNALLTLTHLTPNYLISDVPCERIKVNDRDVTAKDVKRSMTQTVKFNTKQDVNPYSKIKTSYGYGEIEKISVNLTSNNKEVELKYKPE